MKSEEIILGKGRIALSSLHTKIQAGCWCGTTRQQHEPEFNEEEKEQQQQQQVLVDYSQDMIGAICGRGFVVGTAEFGTRINCGSHRGPTLLLDDSQDMIGACGGCVGVVGGTNDVVVNVQHC